MSTTTTQPKSKPHADGATDVPPGYKRTELGAIPIDWGITRLGNLGQCLSGGTPRKNDARFWGGEIPWVSSKDMKRSRLRDVIDHVTDLAVGNGTRLVDAGTILMVVRGMSLVHSFPVAIVERPMAFNQDIKAFVTHSDVSSEFVLRWLQANQAKLLSLATEATHGTKRMPTADLLGSFVPLPEPTEQRAIAGALSDVDGLIGALDKLIAKKRAIKKGAMQQLLTGKTRLRGFSGEWETKRLGEVGDISSAGVDKRSRPDEEPVRLINYLDVYHKDFIYSDDLKHWVTAPTQQARRCAVQKGDVFFTPSSETRDDIGLSAVAMGDIPDAAYSYHVVRLRLRKEWDLRYRTYAFKTRAFLEQAQTLCEGSGTRYVISQAKFRSMIVHVPSLSEQKAIATVLSDIDAEIAALERRRDKTKQINQGMMQSLLTGRVRLVNPPEAGTEA